MYSVDDHLEKLELPELKRKLVEFFDEFSCLIVLDDIDTLTTQKIEVGTSYLNRMLGFAHSAILRHTPSAIRKKCQGWPSMVSIWSSCVSVLGNMK